MFVADRADLTQLRGRVEPAVLRGLGQIDRAGLHHVREGLVGIEAAQIRAQRPGQKAAVFVGLQRQHLVARRLHCAGLMHGDVAARGGCNAFPGAENRGEDGGVRLRPADKKIHVRFRVFHGEADLFLCPRRKRVRSVGVVLDLVRGRQCREELRRAADVVVAGQVDHDALASGKKMCSS